MTSRGDLGDPARCPPYWPEGATRRTGDCQLVTRDQRPFARCLRSGTSETGTVGHLYTQDSRHREKSDSFVPPAPAGTLQQLVSQEKPASLIDERCTNRQDPRPWLLLRPSPPLLLLSKELSVCEWAEISVESCSGAPSSSYVHGPLARP